MELKIDDVNVSNLVLSVRESDEDARDYLYKQFSPLIHKEINAFSKKARMLGIDFADLSQEAMLGFSHAINNFNEDEETKFITFATLCIRRRLVNYIEKFETNKNKVLQESVSLDADVVDEKSSIVDNIQGGADPLRTIINFETLSELEITFNEKLSENEKMALKFDLNGKSVDEIAELMGKNTKQVYNLIHRARTKMKL